LSDQIDDQILRYDFHASPLHDIGKVAIEDCILFKTRETDSEEFEKMKPHTIIGASHWRKFKNRFPKNDFLTWVFKLHDGIMKNGMVRDT
jgi:putative two-component system response regulator